MIKSSLHKFYVPNLRFFEGEGGGAVGGAADNGGGDVGSGATTDGSESGGLNPAWSPMLEKIPGQLHPMVTPYLRDWDKNFQTELQKVQSQYEPYKPFLEQQVSPEQIEQALGLFRLADSDPRRLYDELANYYGYGTDQGQQQVDEGSFDINSGEEGEQLPPELAELRQNQEMLAQVLVAQHQQEQLAAAEKQIDEEIATIKTAHPDLTEDEETMIFQLAAATGQTLTEAADNLLKYKNSAIEQAAASRPAAPSVMSATGTVPGAPPVNPRELDRKGTKNLVASLLQNRT